LQGHGERNDCTYFLLATRQNFGEDRNSPTEKLAMPRFTCPLCGAMLMDRDSSAADRLNSCEECGHTFEEREEEPLPRPRKKRKKKRGRLVLLALVLGGGFLLIAGGIILGILLLRGGNNLLGFNTGINPKVSEANLKKLWAGMSVDQAQAILGDGKECDPEEIARVCKDSFGNDSQLIGWAVAVSGKTCQAKQPKNSNRNHCCPPRPSGR
jgi:hypothetical protein